MSDYKFPLSGEEIAPAIRCPVAEVSANWPQIEACLADMGFASENVCIAMLATVAVETAHTFKPIHEYGSTKYFEEHYQGRADLGDIHPGDGVKYAGRGFIQTTGELNYARDGKLIGVDLVNNPDKALDPGVAAELLCAFAFDHPSLVTAANQGDWTHVRRIVNGGTNGLNDFLQCVEALQSKLKGATT